MFLSRRYVYVGNQKLNEYSMSYGGDMRGGSKVTTIGRYDEKYALYSASQKDTYFQDPEVTYTCQPVIKNLKDGSTVYEAQSQQSYMLYPARGEEIKIWLSKRLEAGSYELSIGDYSCTFEIVE